MKFLKEHAKLIAIVVIFVLAVIILFSIYNSIFLNNSSKYGDRLKGIDEVKVTSNLEKEIKENIKTLDITKSVEIEESGKIINVIALVNDDIEVNKSKEIGNKVIEKLSDKQKKYFDVQIFIKKVVKMRSFL